MGIFFKVLQNCEIDLFMYFAICEIVTGINQFHNFFASDLLKIVSDFGTPPSRTVILMTAMFLKNFHKTVFPALQIFFPEKLQSLFISDLPINFFYSFSG